MKFRPHHLQHIAAAKAGFSERTARRMETFRHSAPQPISNRTRQGPDPFDGLWDSEIRPMLEQHAGDQQLRRPDEGGVGAACRGGGGWARADRSETVGLRTIHDNAARARRHD